MNEEHQLREAFRRQHEGDGPAPLDPGSIIASARRHRRQRIGAVSSAAAALVVAAVVVPQMVSGANSSKSAGSAPEQGAASSAGAAPATEARSGPVRDGAAPGGSAPGLQIEGDQWCVSADSRACWPLAQQRADTTVGGQRWVLGLAPAGADRVVVQDSGGWRPTARMLTGGGRIVGAEPAAGGGVRFRATTGGRVLQEW